MHTRLLQRVRKPAAVGSVLLLVLLTGCQTMTRHAAVSAPAEPAHHQPVEPPADQAPIAHPVVHTASAGDPDLMLFGSDPGRQMAGSQPRSVASLQQQTFTEVGRDFDPDIDSAGKQVVFASTRHCERPNLYLQSTKGRAVTQLTNDPASEIQPRFSPDGKKIAFASDRTGQWDIYVLDLENRTTLQVTHNESHELAPSWSPDGKWLAYSRLSPTGAWELWLVSLDDAAQRCLGPGLLPPWSPDGGELAFQRPRERDGMLFGIWTVKIDHGEPSWPTEIAAEPDAALICPAWSPDGSQIAFCRVPVGGMSGGGATFRPSGADIYIIDAEGTSRMRLTDGGANFGPCWSSEGRLFFSTDRDGRERIWSLRIAGPVKPNLVHAAAMHEETGTSESAHAGRLSGR